MDELESDLSRLSLKELAALYAIETHSSSLIYSATLIFRAMHLIAANVSVIQAEVECARKNIYGTTSPEELS